MRTLRLLLSLSTVFTAVVLLLLVVWQPSHTSSPDKAGTRSRDGHFGALFSFTSPTSLFPPSAIISLTDDNSTFFLARPAAFGPTLPSDGLSGPLWIGSGFGEDNIQGELGCSDSLDNDYDARGSSHSNRKHADIQSLQESAEIDGKVVLLKRGGCGFLAKVLWAQRRGGVAVIVGDDVRGGGLIRMYAKGDTSNVTIPSLFTSHTTAHLLSSLLSPDVQSRKSTPDKSLSRLGPDEAKSHASYVAHMTPARTPSLQPSPVRASSPSITSRSRQDTPKAHVQHTRLRVLTRVVAIWQRSFNRTVCRLPVPNPSLKSMLKPSNVYTKPRISDPSIGSMTHEGLWVTLTPTNVSTSPFFDTLLVLVVSPLVTLTVVYALLLLRSRIRRRRWRAPKSVVERLPVRTYQTVSDSPPTLTPVASSPATPLLQRSASRPTSRPASMPTSPSTRQSSLDSGPRATSASSQPEARDREEEKRESGLAEWRRKYGGRQRECVVCLEEYVDGVSQVMSLPCGHEFHVDCITPWLVTRRRTCPICKGDVVRSLSQSYHNRVRSPSPTRAPRYLSDVDDVQNQAIATRNDSPSASRPVPIIRSGSSNSDDVEANWDSTNSREEPRDIPQNAAADSNGSFRDLSSTVSTVVWRGFEAVRNTTGLTRNVPEDVDRNL